MKTLVLTPEKKYFRDGNYLLFISKWCKWRNDTKVDVNYNFCEFHWDDREKFDQDYIYLKKIHDELLSTLAHALNEIHQVDYSDRAWQMILDPWLLSYIATIWDRWEQIRLAYASQDSKLHLYIDNYIAPEKPPFDYNEHLENVLSDEWNREIYWDIINYMYHESTKFSYLENQDTTKKNRKSTVSISFKQRLKRRLNHLSLRVFRPRKKIFCDLPFGILNQIYLCIRAGCLFAVFPTSSIDRDGFSTSAVMRSRLRRSINNRHSCDTDFETFLNSRLAFALPVAALEAFATIRHRNKEFLQNVDLFISSGSAWNNSALKGCMADAINASIPIIQVEHGGSFPAKHELFDFEEDISDVRCTWYKPYHAKHKKVLHPKIASILNRNFYIYQLYGFLRLRDFCLVIGAESPPYVIRAHYYPMAAQSLTNLELNTKFIDNLPVDIRSFVRIKPYPDTGWNTAQNYLERYGEETLVKNSNLLQSFRRANVIICTYPETSFSEAMASGIPTILLFNPIHYERNAICDELVSEMISVNIIFYDYHDAANHVSQYWHDMGSWWFSPETVEVRNKFLRTALSERKDWLNSWASIVSNTEHVPICPR